MRFMVVQEIRCLNSIHTHHYLIPRLNKLHFCSEYIRLCLNCFGSLQWSRSSHIRNLARRICKPLCYWVRLRLNYRSRSSFSISKSKAHICTCVMINVIFKESPSRLSINISIEIIFQCEGCFVLNSHRESRSKIIPKSKT